MYEGFFGLSETPFSPSPDPRFLLASKTHAAAIAAVQYGIESRSGFVLLTGDPGTGKTTVLRAVLDRLPESTVTGLVFHTAEIEPSDLLKLILTDLGIFDVGDSKADKLIAIDRFLKAQYADGANVAVMVDEAQNLTQRTLEEIRLLSNIETNTEKLIQIVLTGQPELLRKLATPELRQLRQRIAVEHRLQYLQPDEIHPYLETRIEIAGGCFEDIFEMGVEEDFYRATYGCPRLISSLATKCLCSAHAAGAKPITRRIVWSESEHIVPPAQDPASTPASRALRRSDAAALRAGLDTFGIDAIPKR